jgi:outer membrane protein, heavy metal efflux system
VGTLQAKFMLDLAKADLDYYDKIIEISRDRFKAGDLAQIDFDRIELLRVQYESELQTAIVNLRTAKIQLLQLLNDRTPVEQFDVTGDHSISQMRCSRSTTSARSRCPRGPTCRPRWKRFSNRKPITNWPISNGSTDPTFGAWYTYNSSNNNPNGIQTLGASVSIPCASSTATRAKSSAPKSTSTAPAGQRSHARAGFQRRGHGLRVGAKQCRAAEALQGAIQRRGAARARHRDYAYEHGGASLMDFLNAQSDYRQVQLAYAQLIGAYLTAAGQLNLAVGREVIQ